MAMEPNRMRVKTNLMQSGSTMIMVSRRLQPHHMWINLVHTKFDYIILTQFNRHICYKFRHTFCCVFRGKKSAVFVGYFFCFIWFILCIVLCKWMRCLVLNRTITIQNSGKKTAKPTVSFSHDCQCSVEFAFTQIYVECLYF